LNFRFEHSEYLLPLALIPVMIFLFTVVIKWKNTTLKKIGNEKLVKLLILNYSRRNFLIKFVVICIAFALTSFAAANFQTPGGGENIRRQGLDVMIALDVSTSMMATDIQPNRLEKAKLLVNRLIDKLENDQIGLVLFASTVPFGAIRARLTFAVADPRLLIPRFVRNSPFSMTKGMIST